MKQHIKTVKEFNHWRKKQIELVPINLSEALDEVVKAAERYELLLAALDEIKNTVDDYLPSGEEPTPIEALAHKVYLIAMRK